MRNLSIALLAVACFGMCGCGSSSKGPDPAEVQAYNKERNVDPAQASKFLDQLEALPPAQRRDFVNQHPDDMRNLGQIQDQAIQDRFRKITAETEGK